jgi:ABC-type proline/glycine betaine transport system substrate-binding protein
MKNRDIDVFLGNWMPSQGGAHRFHLRHPGDERHSRSPPAPEVAAASWLNAHPAVVASVCPEK